MGLDMYLYAEQCVSGWDHKEEHEKNHYTDVVGAAGLMALADPDTPSAYVRATCAYWRKANAIHRWFVENVQDGEDECKPHYVSEAQLIELRDECQAVLDDPDIAAGRLPTQEGFFFGSYEYDEYYMQHLKYTVERIDFLFENSDPPYINWIYQSSW